MMTSLLRLGDVVAAVPKRADRSSDSMRNAIRTTPDLLQFRSLARIDHHQSIWAVDCNLHIVARTVVGGDLPPKTIQQKHLKPYWSAPGDQIDSHLQICLGDMKPMRPRETMVKVTQPHADRRRIR
jgi:hypothetical protein